jgi:xylan 1,4-beta-xylosidase
MLKEGVRSRPDISALASLENRRLCVLLWHYHDEDIPGPTANLRILLAGLPIASGPVQLRHYRIDNMHSNAFEAWQRMGSPQKPTPMQVNQLEEAGRLQLLEPTRTLRVEKNEAAVQLNLPRQAVSLLILEW